MKFLLKVLFTAICLVGKPFGGIRPCRAYDVLGRLVFDKPLYKWYRNRWGAELYLTPFYHIDRNIIFLGTYDRVLHQFIERLLKPGMVCMDIGANLGEVTLHMASKVAPGGKVFSFEPVPTVFRRLEHHVRHNKMLNIVELHQVALSNTTGSATIGFNSDGEDNQGLASIVNQEEQAFSHSQEIPCTTVDEFVNTHRLARIDLMKIDVEGAEMLILEGGSRTFSSFSPDVLIEFSPGNLHRLSKSSGDMARKLEEYGYQLFHIEKSRLGKRIYSSTLNPSFSASNVFCTKNPVEMYSRLRHN